MPNKDKYFSKQHFMNLALRLLIYTIGIFIFCFGITFVIHALVGVSPSDMLIMSINNAFYLNSYALLLTILNIIIFITAILFYLAKILKKKKKFSYSDFLYYGSQLVPTFTIGPIIVLFEKSFINGLQIENLNYFIRVVIFIGGWILFCIGGTVMVWSDIMQQSYNSIVLDMTVLFNMKFMTARITLDLLFAVTGIIVCLSTRIDKIFDILNVGTFFLTVLTGPFMELILKLLKKTKIKIKFETNENKIENKNNVSQSGKKVDAI